MRWADARTAECRLLRRGRGRAACGALLGTLTLGLVLGCAPARGSGATGTTTPVTEPTAATVACPASTATTSEAQRRLAAAVAAAVGPVPCLVTTYSAADRTATVTVTLAGLVPTTPSAIAAAQERSKVLCFEAQQAVWTSGVALSAATVAVAGPYLDPYDGLTTAPYASAYLTSRTAAAFAWAALSPDAAWGKYDSAFLRPGFDPADGQPTPTP